MDIRKLRGEKTQQDIAKLLSITTSHYGFIETGARRPSLKLAKKISDLYGKSISEIFFEDPYNNR